MPAVSVCRFGELSSWRLFHVWCCSWISYCSCWLFLLMMTSSVVVVVLPLLLLLLAPADVIAVVPTFGNVPSYLYPQLYASEGNKYDVAALKGQLIQFARDTWFMEFSFRFEVSPHHPLPESLSSIAPPFLIS